MVALFVLAFFLFLYTLADFVTLSSLRRPPFCIDKKRGKNDLRGCRPLRNPAGAGRYVKACSCGAMVCFRL